MKYITLAALVVSSVAFISSSASGADPHADTRHCADNREANSTPAGMGRTKLEKRWEVTGLGQHFNIPAAGDFVLYPWCDHPTPGNGDVTKSYVGVQYGGKDGRHYTGYIIEVDCTWNDDC